MTLIKPIDKKTWATGGLAALTVLAGIGISQLGDKSHAPDNVPQTVGNIGVTDIRRFGTHVTQRTDNRALLGQFDPALHGRFRNRSHWPVRCHLT